MQTVLKIFLEWGIKFGAAYEIEEKSSRKVAYADKDELIMEIINRSTTEIDETNDESSVSSEPAAQGGMAQTPAADRPKRKSMQPHSVPKAQTPTGGD